MEFDDQGSDAIPEQGAGVSPRGIIGLVLVALLVAGAAAFVVQNTDSTPVSWLAFEGSAPVWLIMVGSAVVGAVLSQVALWVGRRRRRRD